MPSKVYTNYFYNSEDYDNQDDSYFPLKQSSKTGQHPLNVPSVLKPDNETSTDMYYTITAQTGETQFLPGQRTYTWGYNQGFNGPTIIFKRGKQIHIKLVNHLPEVTSFHFHGLEVSGDVDGGCHTPVQSGQTKNISFNIDQPASTCWLHAHPCPATGEQVWAGLACPIVIKDNQESSLPLPRNYGVDDIPLILQDRNFDQNNQFNYYNDYDPDGTLGKTPVIDGTVNPYFNVTTQKVRLRILDGSNRREWRLHFSNNLAFDQIAGDGSLLPHPVTFTRLMITPAERQEIVVDFGTCKPGQTVWLYSDNTPIIAFHIKAYQPDNTLLPNTLINLPNIPVTPNTPVHHITMDGMDANVEMNGRKFDMKRIDSIQLMGHVELWSITNTNQIDGGMLHPYHMHGCQFQIISRNGKAPLPNETGLKDTVAVQPQETVVVKVQFDHPGVFMYHCHIIEHEDGGMMAQLKVIDPSNPKQQYNLNGMGSMNNFTQQTQNLINNKMNTGMSMNNSMSGMNM